MSSPDPGKSLNCPLIGAAVDDVFDDCITEEEEEEEEKEEEVVLFMLLIMSPKPPILKEERIFNWRERDRVELREGEEGRIG